MFQFLKKKADVVSASINPEYPNPMDAYVPKKNQTTAEIIEEIHESFYTEVDRLLEEAKVLKSLDTEKQDLIDKRNRLVALGITNSKEVKEAQKELDRLSYLDRENKHKESLKEAIEYFSFKYPNYKFITEESIVKICKRYGLIYGSIDKYIGAVPDANLKHIEDFKIDEGDRCIERKLERSWTINTHISYISVADYKKNIEKENEKNYNENDNSFRLYTTPIEIRLSMPDEIERFNVMPLYIAAPIDDFDTNKMDVNEFKLKDMPKIPDPVVLNPVCFKNKLYYLVVTAWGDEASDEIVVNQKMN